MNTYADTIIPSCQLWSGGWSGEWQGPELDSPLNKSAPHTLPKIRSCEMASPRNVRHNGFVATIGYWLGLLKTHYMYIIPLPQVAVIYAVLMWDL